jgi:hypothetical protein
MEIGVDSFAAAFDEASLKETSSQRVRNLVAEIERADQVGLDSFGVGEHHRKEFLDSAPTVILGAAAARTKRIRLSSAVTVLSSNGPGTAGPKVNRGYFSFSRSFFTANCNRRHQRLRPAWGPAVRQGDFASPAACKG